MVSPALDIRNLEKYYGGFHALKSISVSLEQGGFLVLVGPSGCGKSTLLNCIAGLEEISSGRLGIAGRDVTQLPPRERDIAMVFQSYALYPTMTIRENIAFGMKIRGQSRAHINDQVARVAALLKIEPLLGRRPSELSGGQRQRVAMGRALVRDPALFLFDEPLSNLDAKLRMEMRSEIKQMHEKTGTTIVYVTHDQVEAMTMATQIVVMNGGVVQQIGTPDEIYRNPANAFVAEFMGSPPMNLLDVEVDGNAIRFPGNQVVEGAAIPASVRGHDRVRIGIRPESCAPGQMLSARPRIVENTGADVFVTLDMAGQDLVARLPWSATVSGDVGLDIDFSQVRFFSAIDNQSLN